MDKKKILVIGSTGLVGSYFVENYKDKFRILTAGRENCDFQIDLLDTEQIDNVIKNIDATNVLNFAAFTNVDEAEKETGDLNGNVYGLNVLAPLYLAKICLESGKKLYHFSTDYVFDGKKNDSPYKETDTPNPVDSWYTQTKYQGEVKIQEIFENSNLFTIIRISFPFNGLYKRKSDIARAIVDRLKSGKEYQGITDQKIKPTNVKDIAEALSFLIGKNASGIYHVAGCYKNGYVSPFELANKIAEKFILNKSLIKPITFNEYFKDKIVNRPQNTWLDTTKIENLGMKFLIEEESLENFKKDYIDSHFHGNDKGD